MATGSPPYALLDFVYRTQFAGGEAAQRKHVRLCFDGLDTVCDIFLNGERIGATENCFTGYELDVTGRVSEGPNTLWLLFRSPVREAEKRRERFGRILPAPHDGDFMYIRKPAYAFFWDWGPRMPVSGIWRPVSLKAFDRAEMAVVPFEVPGARLWYPNGEGEPFLYDLEMMLQDGMFCCAMYPDTDPAFVALPSRGWARTLEHEGREGESQWIGRAGQSRARGTSSSRCPTRSLAPALPSKGRWVCTA